MKIISKRLKKTKLEKSVEDFLKYRFPHLTLTVKSTDDASTGIKTVKLYVDDKLYVSWIWTSVLEQSLKSRGVDVDMEILNLINDHLYQSLIKKYQPAIYFQFDL